jgi:uncharacterized protein (UPF0147 family)
MKEDPRWEQALQLLKQAEAAHNRGDTQAIARAFERCLHTLDSLAIDPAVPRVERRRAAKLLEKIDAQISASLPALLLRLAELRDTATDAGQRAEAAAMLAHATERLPAASDARH